MGATNFCGIIRIASVEWTGCSAPSIVIKIGADTRILITFAIRSRRRRPRLIARGLLENEDDVRLIGEADLVVSQREHVDGLSACPGWGVGGNSGHLTCVGRIRW